MHVARIARTYKDRQYVYHLLRQSYREGKQVKHRTLANLSHLSPRVIDLIRGALAGEEFIPRSSALEVVRSLPHGHVAAVVGMARKLGLEELLGPGPGRLREVVLGMVAARVVDPASKLATSQRWESSTLGEMLGVAGAGEDELYAALDWLLGRQAAVEAGLARRHLAEGSLVLYDVTSTYVTGRSCPLAARGYSRDRRPDREQVVFGLVLDVEGRPLSVDVFPGNTADPSTVERQIEKLESRFGLRRVVLVGDRGMLTQARIEGLKERGGVGWISCLRAPAIQGLVKRGSLQLSLFDERDLAEISDPAYPDERLIVCRNPFLAEERARKRQELLAATEKGLLRVKALVEGGRLRSPGGIGLRAGQALNRFKVGKHFSLAISEGSFGFMRQEGGIAAEAALDGIYIVHTSVGAGQMDAAGVVKAYKSLSHAEQAFRSIKTVDIEVRPIFHYRAGRVRAHILLCMLACYVAWHLKAAWAPLLFKDEAPPERPHPVARAGRSQEARRKDRTHQREGPDGQSLPVQSFHSLLAHLATLTQNRIVPRGLGEEAAFEQLTVPSPVQARAFELLGFPPQAV